MKFIANSIRNANRSDMLQSIFADKSVLPSTFQPVDKSTSSSRVALTRISISSKFYFPSLLHFRRDTRELSHALVMQRRSTPLPEVIHAISKIVWEYRLEGTRL